MLHHITVLSVLSLSFSFEIINIVYFIDNLKNINLCINKIIYTKRNRKQHLYTYTCYRGVNDDLLKTILIRKVISLVKITVIKSFDCFSNVCHENIIY